MYNIKLGSWNEWDEGYFIAHSHKFGYNKSWITPDFSKFCQTKLEE